MKDKKKLKNKKYFLGKYIIIIFISKNFFKIYKSVDYILVYLYPLILISFFLILFYKKKIQYI